MPDRTRIEELEIALVDYIRRYGLTDLARQAMIPPKAPSPPLPPKLIWIREQPGESA